MRSRVRFPVLPCEFSLKGKIPAVTMVWVDKHNLGLRPLLALHPPLSPLTYHRDNVTAPHGRPNLRSLLHFCHAQEGGPRSPQRTCCGIGKKKIIIIIIIIIIISRYTQLFYKTYFIVLYDCCTYCKDFAVLYSRFHIMHALQYSCSHTIALSVHWKIRTSLEAMLIWARK